MKRIATLALALTAVPLTVAQAAPTPPASASELEFPNELNLVVSIAVWAIAFFVLLWPKKPALLKENPALVKILLYWVGQWLCFTLIWIWIVAGGNNDIVTLLLSDLQSLLAIGFSIGFFMGTDYLANRAQVISSLILVFTAFLIFDVATGLHYGGAGLSASISPGWRQAPSQVLSVVADGAIALAFLFRYGPSAIPITLACIAYASLQHPAYQALSSPGGTVNVRLALAAGKVFLGSAFYATFFNRAANYDPIKLPVPPPASAGPILRSGFLYALGLAAVCVGFSLITTPTWLPDIRKAGLSLLTLLLGPLIAEALKGPILKFLGLFSKKQPAEEPPSGPTQR